MKFGIGRWPTYAKILKTDCEDTVVSECNKGKQNNENKPVDNGDVSEFAPTDDRYLGLCDGCMYERERERGRQTDGTRLKIFWCQMRQDDSIRAFQYLSQLGRGYFLSEIQTSDVGVEFLVLYAHVQKKMYGVIHNNN